MLTYRNFNKILEKISNVGHKYTFQIYSNLQKRGLNLTVSLINQKDTKLCKQAHKI